MVRADNTKVEVRDMGGREIIRSANNCASDKKACSAHVSTHCKFVLPCLTQSAGTPGGRRPSEAAFKHPSSVQRRPPPERGGVED